MTTTPLRLIPPLQRWSVPRLLATSAVGLLLWAIVAAGCLCVGSNGKIAWPADALVRSYRLEVVLLSSLVGACLAAAGVVYQAILRNPLADPYLLGVSSGASLCAYLWRFPFTLALSSFAVAMGQQAFSFAGALAAVSVVLLLSNRWGRLDPLTLLLVGVIVNAINGSIFLLLNTLYPELTQGSGGALGFLVGGIQTNLTLGQELSAAIVAGAGWIVLMFLGGRLNVASAGEAEALALGVRIQQLRWIGLIVASFVTAAGVAVSGPIGFVGLICPHVARRLIGTDQRKLLPWSTALGAALLAVADAASRLVAGRQFASTVLPVGVLTALLGGPFFLLLLWEGRRRNES